MPVKQNPQHRKRKAKGRALHKAMMNSRMYQDFVRKTGLVPPVKVVREFRVYQKEIMKILRGT